jgi:hypothetical protein
VLKCGGHFAAAAKAFRWREKLCAVLEPRAIHIFVAVTQKDYPVFSGVRKL